MRRPRKEGSRHGFPAYQGPPVEATKKYGKSVGYHRLRGTRPILNGLVIRNIHNVV